MSFHNKNFWLRRESLCFTDGKMNIESSSKVEQKRTHQWDIPLREFFSNKKQAVESTASRSTLAENVDISLWNNLSSPHSVSAFSDNLFVPETLGICDLSDKPISSTHTGNLDAEREGGIDQFENSSAINLAMTHDLEQSFCGIGKANLNQARDSGNGFSVSMVQPLTTRESDIFTRCIAYQGSDNSVVLQPTYQKENINAISPVPMFRKSDNIISMGQTLTKGNNDPVLIGHNCRKENNYMPPAALPYNKWNCNLIPIDQQYGKETSSFMSIGPAYDKEHENFLMINHTFDKTADMSVSTAFDKGDDVLSAVGPTQNKKDSAAVPKDIIYGKQNSNILSMDQNYDEGEATTISFGTEASDLTARLIGNSDLSIRESSERPIEAHTQNDLTEQNVDQVASVASTSSRADGAFKGKEQKKKIASNNFPSNVKSMLSTGIFDGVPVTYASWSREKNLQGLIKGTGYLCGCKDCDHSKALNAYEFERHAGGKTKHPNNHIFFENGKSVYAAVQELKSTPQEMLFEAIEKVTGSSINQKNFRIWKVSYQAATRELERIYGKDEAFQRS